MALIKCSDCGKEISPNAISCPSCGNPINVPKRTSVSGVVIKVILTLIALVLIVFVIIPGACFGTAWMVGDRVVNRYSEAKHEATEIQIKNFVSALKLFKLDNGFYPETQQGLDALIEKPSVGQAPCCYSAEAYLEGYEIPLDQWGNQYIYLGPDQTLEGGIEVISIGPDGIRDTEDDISSWSIK
ncbi:MAG: type II secretion system major pseudopilin GspG [Candidatus Dadabacteria bacterium]